MNKKELSEYRYIVKEIERLENAVASEFEHSKVSGSHSEFPFTRRTFSVSGIRHSGKNAETLAQIKALKKQKAKVDRFISSIADRMTKRIFVLKYIQGERKPTWNEVADEIGGGNNGDNIRMSVNNYLKKHPF